MGRIVFILAEDPCRIRSSERTGQFDPSRGDPLRRRRGAPRPGAGPDPEAIIGDMDSLDDERRASSPGRVPAPPASPEKDETDTDLALAEAMGMNPDAVWIFAP
jgi:hypothetical protein